MQKCCTSQIKLASHFVPLHVINSECHAKALANTEVQCAQRKGRSQGAALRAHKLPRDHTRPLTTPLFVTQSFPSAWRSSRQNKALCSITLLWGALCFQRVGQRPPSTALAMEIYCHTLCNTTENRGLFPLHFHCMITDKAAPKGEWLVLQSWANNLRWQIKFHQISGSMTVLGIIRMHAGRDDISDSFKINRGKRRSPTVRRKQ